MSDPANEDIRKAGRQASHQFTTFERIAGALKDLRLRFFPRRILVAGPYVGEFGHELMDWQPWVRAQIARHDEVHVIGSLDLVQSLLGFGLVDRLTAEMAKGNLEAALSAAASGAADMLAPHFPPNAETVPKGARFHSA